MTPHEEIINILLEAPDSQIDKSIVERLGMLKSTSIDRKLEMMSILDDCIYGALASDFAMKAMYYVFFEILGGTKEDLANYKSKYFSNEEA